MNTRPYVQRARAEAAAATGARILAASITLFLESGAPPTLDAVAQRAGVTVQTVLRRFGSKEGLQQAALDHARGRVVAARDAAPVGDVRGAIANLVTHYVEWGDVSLRLLALEAAGTEAARETREGRAYHHAWVARVFAPWLDTLAPDARRRRHAQLVAVTDVYAWTVLHRDLGLSPDEVEATLVDLVERLLA